jgi:hypothetical protein
LWRGSVRFRLAFFEFGRFLASAGCFRVLAFVVLSAMQLPVPARFTCVTFGCVGFLEVQNFLVAAPGHRQRLSR